MGICFSKKKPPLSPSPLPPKVPIPEEKNSKKKVLAEADEVEEKRKYVSKPKEVAEVASAVVEKKPVFVLMQTPKKSVSSEEREQRKRGEVDRENIVAIPKEESRPAAVRASSCTKEEVDAILIQCGRLSRSSSGKTSNDANHRKYSGSKRSYDFDNDKSRDEEEEWEKPSSASRPSPLRRTPTRERDGSRDHKRSGSRERGSGGSRRVSRSPGRRSDGPASSAGDKPRQTQQPGKMVSVPAREKGGVNAVTHNAEPSGAAGVKRVPATPMANKRNAASSRSNSPARTVLNENGGVLLLHQTAQPQSLSRSSSRKAEHSPYTRNPMAEIDDNSLRPNQNIGGNTNRAQKSREGEETLRKPSPKRTSDHRNNAANDTKGTKISNSHQNSNNVSNCVREQLMSYKAKEKQPEAEIVEEDKEVRTAANGTDAESLNVKSFTRSRSSRKSSRDFDHLPGLNPETLRTNPTSYTSVLLEDIQNYHQQNAAFSLPACVSKACSILEAVADLNSSSSDQSSNDNGRFGRSGLALRESMVESEIVVKDDVMEPSLHKYIAVRELGVELEPQESAGSNSFIGQPWASSQEPNSADSTDRYWVSQSNDGEEVEEPSKEVVHEFGSRGKKTRGGGSTSNVFSTATASSGSGKNRSGLDHRQLQRGGSGVGGGNVKGGGRAH